jgi:hypothetical protein
VYAQKTCRDNWGPTPDGCCWISGGENPYRLLFYGPLFIYIFSALALFIYGKRALLHGLSVVGEECVLSTASTTRAPFC